MKFCNSVDIFIINIKYTFLAVYSAQDKIALLAVESRHLQIWVKDEYETQLQNVTFYY